MSRFPHFYPYFSHLLRFALPRAELARKSPRTPSPSCLPSLTCGSHLAGCLSPLPDPIEVLLHAPPLRRSGHAEPAGAQGRGSPRRSPPHAAVLSLLPSPRRPSRRTGHAALTSPRGPAHFSPPRAARTARCPSRRTAPLAAPWERLSFPPSASTTPSPLACRNRVFSPKSPPTTLPRRRAIPAAPSRLYPSRHFGELATTLTVVSPTSISPAVLPFAPSTASFHRRSRAHVASHRCSSAGQSEGTGVLPACPRWSAASRPPRRPAGAPAQPRRRRALPHELLSSRPARARPRVSLSRP